MGLSPRSRSPKACRPRSPSCNDSTVYCCTTISELSSSFLPWASSVMATSSSASLLISSACICASRASAVASSPRVDPRWASAASSRRWDCLSAATARANFLLDSSNSFLASPSWPLTPRLCRSRSSFLPATDGLATAAEISASTTMHAKKALRVLVTMTSTLGKSSRKREGVDGCDWCYSCDSRSSEQRVKAFPHVRAPARAVAGRVRRRGTCGSSRRSGPAPTAGRARWCSPSP